MKQLHIDAECGEYTFSVTYYHGDVAMYELYINNMHYLWEEGDAYLYEFSTDDLGIIFGESHRLGEVFDYAFEEVA